MKEVSIINLFKVFFKIGVILLGGGYVIVPILNEELVKKRNWLSSDDVINYYCMSQCLPGIIAINTSILVGYKLKKLQGVFVSLFAMVLSPFLSIILIAHCINKIMGVAFIDSIFYGVNLAVIVLIYLTLKDMWEKSISDKFTFFWFLFILILSLLKINPVILVLASIIFGIFLKKITDIKNVKS